MTERHEPLCKVKGCPAPNDPGWHIPWCGHGLEGHHQHWPKRSQGGTEIVSFICPGCHDHIDNGHWGNAVLKLPDGTRLYRVWDQNNRTVFERVIGRWREEEPEQPQEPQETTLELHESRLPVEYLPTGLVLPENLTREQWEELASTIQQMAVSVPWWVGDLLVYGQRFGEEMWQAIKERGGADYERLRKYMWVSERIAIGTRVPALKWSHHREVADLEPDDQRVWLQRALDEGLSVNALRKAISGEQPEPPCPDSATGRHEYICKHCGKEKP